MVYLSDWWDGILRAIDSETGADRWTYQSADRIIPGAAVTESIVVISDTSGSVTALDSSTGKTAWSLEGYSAIQTGVSTDGLRAFFGTSGGQVYGLDLSDGSVVWEMEVGSSPWARGVAVGDGIVYFAHSDELIRALNVETGESIWESALDSVPSGPMTVQHGMVFAGSVSGMAYAFDAATGETVWSYKTDGFIMGPPVAWNDTAFFGSDDGFVYAVGLDDGELKWRFRSGGHVRSMLAADAGVVYFGATDGFAYALDAETGSLAWKFGAGQEVGGRVVVDGGIVYFLSYTSYIHALVAGLPEDFDPDAPTVCPTASAGQLLLVLTDNNRRASDTPEAGSLIWSLEGNQNLREWILFDGDTTYLSAGDGSLYAVHSSTERTKWSYGTSGPINAEPAISGDLLVFADAGGCVHAVNRESGEAVWQTALGSPPKGNVSADGERVYMALSNGDVQALYLEDGSAAWNFAPKGWPQGGVTLADESVYFATDSALVYALEAPTGDELWQAETLYGSSTAPIITDGLVIAGSPDERVYAFDAETGALAWNYWALQPVRASVVESDGDVFFASDKGYAYSVDVLTGRLNWRATTTKMVSSASGATGGQEEVSPAVDGGLAYAVSDQDEIVALDAENGAEVWRFDARAAVTSLEAGNENVYASLSDGRIIALAGGFSEDYEPPDPPLPSEEPEFVPLTPLEIRDAIEFLTEADERQVRVEAQVTTTEGKYWTIVDHSDQVIGVFGAAYYLLTGRSYQQDGIEARYPTRAENLARYGDRAPHYGGFCCEQTETGLVFVVRGEFPLKWAVRASAHEVGHALQRLLNPAQMRAAGPLAGALWEAQAGSFEGAVFRTIGEYADLESAAFPNDQWARQEIDALRQRMQNALSDEPQGPQDRSSIIIWHAILHDPDLAHLKEELDREGRLSGASYLELYYKLAMIPPSQVTPYVEAITPDTRAEISNDLNYITSILIKRIGRGPHPGFIALVETTLLLP